MMTELRWGLARRSGARFGVALALLWLAPFPLSELPLGDKLYEWWDLAWQWLLARVGHLLGLEGFAPSPYGDSLAAYVKQLVMLALAAVIAVVWSTLDRRAARPRLVDAVWCLLRYSLAYQLFVYGGFKFIAGQFPALRPGDLDTPLGEFTPMGLMWAFMSYSKVYAGFAGALEISAGVLLLWRGTATLGAVAAAAVMANVVMMDFCFGVPIKIYATQLLVVAIALALPGLRRIIAASLGHAVAPLPPRPRRARWFERARVAMPWLALANFAWGFFPNIAYSLARDDHKHALYGAWTVDEFVVDGAVVPPLATDPARWRKLLINANGLWIAPMTGERAPARLVVDEVAQTMTVTPGDGYSAARLDGSKPPRAPDEQWRYALTAEALVIEAEGRRLRATLHREPPPRLLTRRFRWIQPQPDRARDAVP